MTFGVIALIVVSLWALVSIVASLIVGGMAKERDDVVGSLRTPVVEHAHHGFRRAS